VLCRSLRSPKSSSAASQSPETLAQIPILRPENVVVIMTDKLERKEIAYRDNTITKENLPFPIVLYPGFYGAFFGFRQREDSPIVLCSCAKEAIENYLRFRLSKPIPPNTDPGRMFALDSMYFPRALIDTLMKRGVQNNYEVMNYLVFESNLCHECNGVVPKYRYCHEMYGGAFKQNYGRYINRLVAN
jgi:hypothetical protein